MKTTLLLLLVMMIGSSAFTQKIQEKDVPANIRAAFQKQYPKVTKAKWSKEGVNFEAEFDLNKEESSVLMDASGNLIETEVEIETSQLPKEIATYIKANYSNKSIKEAAKITDVKGIVTYEAEIKGKDLIFDSTGKFIKEVKE
jgi:hypothetical protein